MRRAGPGGRQHLIGLITFALLRWQVEEMRRLMVELDTPAPAGAAEPRNERARQLSEKVRQADSDRVRGSGSASAHCSATQARSGLARRISMEADQTGIL